MNTSRHLLALGGLALVIGLQPIVFGQGAQQAPTTQQPPPSQRGATPPQAQATQQAPTVDQRVRQLELNIIALQSELQRRTATLSGPDDGITRDFNLETRLGNIERQVQQLGNSVLDLQRQIGDAARAASQAQNDAMLAQQIARDAQARVN
jgi:hypothetical protein